MTALEKLAEVRAHRGRFAEAFKNIICRAIENIEPRESVIEIGAGDGQLAEYLGPALRERLVVSEPDPLCHPALHARSPTARVVHASAHELPFEDSSFDLVLACCVLDVLDDPEQVYAELLRVLKPGGRFLHFLDMSTDLRVFFEALGDAGSAIALPNVFTEVLATEWPQDIFVVDRAELELLRQWVNSAPEGEMLEVFLRAADSPPLALTVYEQVNGSELDRQRLIRCFELGRERVPEAQRNQADGFHGRTVSSAFLFHARMLAAAREAGFDVTRAGIERERLARSDDHALASIVGFVRSGRALAPGSGFTELGVHVLELQKNV
ncbi:MAG: class I SAM-dependent methyltransferase [Myxococcota bacterium]